MSALDVDLLSVALLVGAAVSFLVYRLYKPAPPACHALARATTSANAPDVVIGASLEKGLRRAQQRRSPPHASAMQR